MFRLQCLPIPTSLNTDESRHDIRPDTFLSQHAFCILLEFISLGLSRGYANDDLL
jgi:hypothetical protein